jgi:hypothetical protein
MTWTESNVKKGIDEIGRIVELIIKLFQPNISPKTALLSVPLFKEVNLSCKRNTGKAIIIDVDIESQCVLNSKE